MIIAALNEGNKDTRVAITPKIISHYLKRGFAVNCEHNAGAKAGFRDEDYQQAGANIVNDRAQLLATANILLLINELEVEELAGLASHALIIGHINNKEDSNLLSWCRQQKISVFSMNYIPRITRAQNIDSLSSQANLAGYRAVIEAIAHYKRVIPMMMTAAGMIHPAKVLILGAGVAGLQAIATAKRLGAVVYAFDVRSAAKEQVESLGAEFIAVTSADNETQTGYAKETSAEYQLLQAELISSYAQKADLIITTALIPGKKAPVLLSKNILDQMKSGAVIVDLATSQGGNCELSLKDQIIQYRDLTLIGYSNFAGLVPATASELYANNLNNLLDLLTTNAEFSFNAKDEIIQQAMLCHDGIYLPWRAQEKDGRS